MSNKKRPKKSIEQISDFSEALNSAIDTNRPIRMVYWRMQGERTTRTDSFTPIVICAGLLPQHLIQEVYHEYRRSSALHQSNKTISAVQIWYLTLYLINKQGPPDKNSGDETQGFFWSKYGTTSGLKQTTFSHYVWRVTKKGHLILFVEPLPQQVHLLYGDLGRDKDNKVVWIWTDQGLNPETGCKEPIRIDETLFLQ